MTIHKIAVSFELFWFLFSCIHKKAHWTCFLVSKHDFLFYLPSGNFMYFVGYSKWLLLCSRLVAGDAHTQTHTHACSETIPTPPTHYTYLRILTLGVRWCFPLRCWCRSRLFYLWFPDSEHSARGARWYLCCHHGLSTSWLTCRSVPSPYILPQREVSFHLPFLFPVFWDTSHIKKDFMMFSLMFSFYCEKETFNKITKLEATDSSILLLFHLLFKALPSVSPGPAFNLFLRLCDFKLGPFAVNKYTSPGVKASI